MDAMEKTKIMTLNKLGYNLVEFTNPVTQEKDLYLYDRFDPVDISGSNHTHKHKVRGIDVTDFIRMRAGLLHENLNQIEEGTLRSHLNTITKSNHEFSEQYLWKGYLSI